jgi:hypothetical protein
MKDRVKVSWRTKVERMIGEARDTLFNDGSAATEGKGVLETC